MPLMVEGFTAIYCSSCRWVTGSGWRCRYISARHWTGVTPYCRSERSMTIRIRCWHWPSSRPR